jgi:hypothetical protein
LSQRHVCVSLIFWVRWGSVWAAQRLRKCQQVTSEANLSGPGCNWTDRPSTDAVPNLNWQHWMSIHHEAKGLGREYLPERGATSGGVKEAKTRPAQHTIIQTKILRVAAQQANKVIVEHHLGLIQGPNQTRHSSNGRQDCKAAHQDPYSPGLGVLMWSFLRRASGAKMLRRWMLRIRSGTTG